MQLPDLLLDIREMSSSPRRTFDFVQSELSLSKTNAIPACATVENAQICHSKKKWAQFSYFDWNLLKGEFLERLIQSTANHLTDYAIQLARSFSYTLNLILYFVMCDPSLINQFDWL